MTQHTVSTTIPEEITKEEYWKRVNESNCTALIAQIQLRDKELTTKDQTIEKLKEGLEKINIMTRLPGEHTDTFCFNRCWHIANELLQSINQKEP